LEMRLELKLMTSCTITNRKRYSGAITIHHTRMCRPVGSRVTQDIDIDIALLAPTSDMRILLLCAVKDKWVSDPLSSLGVPNIAPSLDAAEIESRHTRDETR
jgi:hypothetical protein